ncbi:hypothetical protein [Sphingobacterium paucimobilis]|uniref:Uncharacterized protein n=1 Tax=Sphingobacterium paucimobilis HER1398 TaxID=1346330 RepID=U2JC34_9SPHI|nr:hypothetical protein [Sphingobacterium paucimobilis]ERJ60223.1 hypothetical protein M472_15800 [Sphingobacterium paucimobilis HER1398]
MKYSFPVLFLFSILLSLIYACSSPLEESLPEVETKELKLSIPNENNGILETDELEIELEIIDGNGEYVANVSQTDGEPDAKVVITGNKIKVDLLTRDMVELTITDKKLQEASIRIRSTHKSLEVPSFGLLLSEGQTYLMKDIQFGAGGPYTIKSIKGDASTAAIENDGIKITSKKLGNTYYRLKDKRGTVALLEVSTTLNVDLTTNYLELEGNNTMSVTVNLPKDTDWLILSSTNKVTESVKVDRPIDPKTGSHVDFQVLFIETSDDGKGTDTITLKNKDGELAVVRIWVR